MLDVRLFANLRFTAASGAVTTAFFALFGFTFMIIQYFQIMRGYSALSAGVRILPVAVTLAIASGMGPLLAVRIGNKAVVAGGLLLLGSGPFWVSFQTATISYELIVGQMILLGLGLGLGLGLSTAPAIEAIMGVVRPEQAGAGSAVNDATRLIGVSRSSAASRSAFTDPPSRSPPSPPPLATPHRPATPPATPLLPSSRSTPGTCSRLQPTAASSTACMPDAMCAPGSASWAS